MEFYPLGTVPTSYPSWYVDGLANVGLNANATSMWLLSADEKQEFVNGVFGRAEKWAAATGWTAQSLATSAPV